MSKATGTGRGGRREGAGRPLVEEKRRRRALCFLNAEWELIQKKAQSLNMSPREYIYSLVEKDNKKNKEPAIKAKTMKN